MMDTYSTQFANFKRIEKAIEYISLNYQFQPNLKEIADHVNLSPYHFQRMFTEWAGISPKQFLKYISIAHAKDLLQKQQLSLFDTADKIGLSSTSRLHDLFVHIEGMTPGEYKNKGENLVINYSFSGSPFGKVIIASTSRGICYMGFIDDEMKASESLREMYPNAKYYCRTDSFQQNAISVFTPRKGKPNRIKIHIKGTDFQIKVWKALLSIPMGEVTTYGKIAESLSDPNAARAVGSAVGKNPIAFLIPCHRVIRATGLFGEYRWGSVRKVAMIGWEGARIFIGSPYSKK